MQASAGNRAVLFTMLIFYAQPLLMGAWLSQVSGIQTGLGVDKAVLSLGLMGMPAGLVPTLYFAGKIVEKRGPRRSLLLMFPPMLFLAALPGFVNTIGAMFVVLFLLGMCIAVVQLSLNVYAGRVEQASGRFIMNRAHGFWSAGVMTGSLIAVRIATMGAEPGPILGGMAIVLLPVLMGIAWFAPHVAVHEQGDASPGPRRAIPKALIFVTFVVLGATFIEGTMTDWASIYMREIVHLSQGKEGLAVAIFAGLVTLGRFIGDGLAVLIGPVRLARVCLTSAIAGILTLVVSANEQLAYLGFALVGFGASTIFPLGVSACAAMDLENVERNVAVMTFGALMGLLLAPPTIGFLSEITSLSTALAVLLPGAVVSFLLAYHLKPSPGLAQQNVDTHIKIQQIN